MLAIAPVTDPDDDAERDGTSNASDEREPVNFPRASSGDPTFASRADEILKSSYAKSCRETL